MEWNYLDNKLYLLELLVVEPSLFHLKTNAEIFLIFSDRTINN